MVGAIILGYLMVFLRNVIAGYPQPLPEWTDWGTRMADGFKAMVVTIVYGLPAIIVFAIFLVPSILLSVTGNRGAGALGSGLFCLGLVLFIVTVLLSSLLMPIAIFVRGRHAMGEILLLDLPCFMAATMSVCSFYAISQKEIGEGNFQRLKYIPFVMSLGIGLALSNAKAVMEAGARSVMACATHGVLSGPAIKRIEESVLTEVIVTDTIPLTAAARACAKVRVLSVARLLGEAIKRIHHGDSISNLFI